MFKTMQIRESTVMTTAAIPANASGYLNSGTIPQLNMVSTTQGLLGDLPVQKFLFHRGETLFHAGEVADDVYVILSGSVKNFVTDAAGDMQVTGFGLAGDIIGFDAFTNSRRRTSAEALDTTYVACIPAEIVLEGRACDKLHREILRATCRANLDQQEHALQISSKSATQRVAWLLLTMATQAKTRGLDDTDLNLPMSRGDIANYLGLALETVCRVIKGLKTKGAIAVNRRQVKLVDVNLLHHIVGDIVDETAAA